MAVINLKKMTSDAMPVHWSILTILRGLKARKRVVWGWVPLAVGLACAFLLTACAMDHAKKREQANLRMDVGVAYIETGDYNTALKELLIAEQYTPKNSRIHYFIAIAYNGMGYQEKAIDACKAAISLKNDYSEAHNLLGTLYMNKAAYDLAISSFTKALENLLYETPAIALYNLGRVYDLLGDYPKAMAKYQEAVARNTRVDFLPLIEHGMGKVRYAQGDVSRATTHFKKSTELAPSYVESHYWLGECYMKSGKLKEARKAFQTVIKLAPTSDLGHKAKEHLDRIKT